MKYAYSFDELEYFGGYNSVAEAVDEACAEGAPGQSFWVGEEMPPSDPESMWDASDWLEHVSQQDEYSPDCADGWDVSTKEQLEELEKEVRAVMAAWLDKHNLRPAFFVIKNVERRQITPAESLAVQSIAMQLDAGDYERTDGIGNPNPDGRYLTRKGDGK